MVKKKGAACFVVLFCFVSSVSQSDVIFGTKNKTFSSSSLCTHLFMKRDIMVQSDPAKSKLCDVIFIFIV